MKATILILALLFSLVMVPASSHAAYSRNPATAVCYGDKDSTDSLRIRYRNGHMEAVAIDQLEAGHYGNDILVKRIPPNPGQTLERYIMAENYIVVPVNVQTHSGQSDFHWKAVVKNENDPYFVISYTCSF